ncbi:MAG: hypothetical protein NTU53_13135 [Planctomycetota bacterium]|nr:hypothetical protein [Planctomycetota bacterium]
MIKTLGRSSVGLLVVAFFVASSGLVSAQVLKYVRDDALVVIKVNNPQGISDKAAAMAQKMGLANLNPGFADPLSLLKEKLNLKAGIDFKGEAAVVVFRPPAGEREPRALALIPVSDYKAFLGNFANVKKEGDADTFCIQPDGEAVFAVQWGTYAAVSPWKDLLLEQPTGLKVAGIVAKQYAEKDITAYLNMKPIREMVLPQVQGIRAEVAGMLVAQPGQAPGQAAFQRAMAMQIFDAVEAFLTQSQAAALSMNLAPGGVAYTLSVHFLPDSGIGKAITGVSNTEANLITSLPKEKYLVFGGWVQNGPGMWELHKAFYEKPIKAAMLGEADTKAVADVLAATEKMLTSTKSGEFGLIAPPQGTGITPGLVRGILVMNGDAKTIQDSKRKSMAAQEVFMKATGNQGLDLKVMSQATTKTIEGVQLDQFQMVFTIDPKSLPAAMQILQVLNGKGVTSLAGAVNDKTFVSTTSLDDAQVQAAIVAAKQSQSPLASLDTIKAASEQLPKSRIAVGYIALDNILSTAFDIAAQMGAAVPLKVPADLPPIGVSISSEGSTVRFDACIPSTLIENMVSLGMQAAMQQGTRRGLPAAP